MIVLSLCSFQSCI